jgi:hypothetical protein
MSSLLNSWKEIAAYVHRGVRTVQRWERELQFPVRRPRGHSRSPVIAFSDDIDQWLSQCPTSEIPCSAAPRVQFSIQRWDLQVGRLPGDPPNILASSRREIEGCRLARQELQILRTANRRLRVDLEQSISELCENCQTLASGMANNHGQVSTNTISRAVATAVLELP